MSKHTTRQDAIEVEIITAIEATGEATRDEFDIDAIADEVLSGHDDGYQVAVDETAFWKSVANHQR